MSENCEFSAMKDIFIVLTAIFWLFSAPVWAQSKDEVLKQKIDAVKKEIEGDLAEIENILLEMKALVTRPDTSVITGYYRQSILFSMHPDAKFVGVYLMIDDKYKYSIDDLVLPIKSYFDHYKIPLILVKQEKPFKGNGASMLVFVNGKCVFGDQPNGDFSLYNVQQNHEQVFKKIKSCYDLAQEGRLGRE